MTGTTFSEENLEDEQESPDQGPDVTRGQDAGVIFRVVVADAAEAFPDPFELIPLTKRIAAGLLVEALLAELHDRPNADPLELTHHQLDAVVVSAGLLAERIEVIEISDGSVILTLAASLPTVLHWLSSIEAVVTAVGFGPKLLHLGRRIIRRLKGTQEGRLPELPEWIKDLPEGSRVTVDGRNQVVVIEVGAHK
jgi:hypothetical protein